MRLSKDHTRLALEYKSSTVTRYNHPSSIQISPNMLISPTQAVFAFFALKFIFKILLIQVTYAWS